MYFDIKELRESTGLTQKAFAEMYGIPISTLRKWEQGEASPAAYVVNLLARTLPSTNSSLQKITGRDGVSYYYDKNQKLISDMRGNKIFIQEDLEGVKEQNLALYLKDLFDSFYEIQEKFNRDCKYDKEEDIIWI
ncbi:MAG: helix-turn-helix domain-containing protein [Frisingicoccus sp.]|uniref:helix-turn-helix domain-containing protein n=1 Tax=Lachnospiraceae TaxID=186803 RepID=UPI001F388DA2|nr:MULTISPECIES: helix-turn-helix domain-containing protein [Lachnospiraceae]MCF2680600.1 helix-turn-helix domain-containing protein [Faecalicatena contorta]MDD6232430.1 helix-turn-helix domain-containing protein [Frisingicoccus sp.]